MFLSPCSTLPWAPAKAKHHDDDKEHLDDLLPWLLHPDRIALLLSTAFAFEAHVQIVFILVIYNFDRVSSALVILTSFSLNLEWDLSWEHPLLPKRVSSNLEWFMFPDRLLVTNSVSSSTCDTEGRNILLVFVRAVMVLVDLQRAWITFENRVIFILQSCESLYRHSLDLHFIFKYTDLSNICLTFGIRLPLHQIDPFKNVCIYWTTNLVIWWWHEKERDDEYDDHLIRRHHCS